MNTSTIITAWPELASEPVRPLPGGLINATFVVGEPPRAVLQRQHSMFPPRVNRDIEAVTAHLADRGMLTPRIVRTGVDAPCHVDPEGATWRVLTWVPGCTVDTVDSLARAAAAGGLVARWHRATADLQHTFGFVRPGAHDTPAHMRRLGDALDEHGSHRLHSDVARLGEWLLDAWERWEGDLQGAPRVTHGDLKISNLRFDQAGHGLCLLDFDTLGRLPIEVELGDAARSWCNPSGEDVADATFDADRFAAAFGAYLAHNPLPAEQRAGLVPTCQRICLELSARFAADALAETYFGWNPDVAPTRGDHNLLRARGQRSLAASMDALRPTLERVVTAR